MSNNSFYITTPIFYPNGVPHIGHAYTALACDAIARFHRLDGRDVFFLTGTDEHGLKMQQTAEKEGISTLELATRNAEVFDQLWGALNISYDDFIRTTEQRHHESSQEIWKRMAANGDIYLDTYAGWYSVTQEAYFEEKETEVGEDGIRREPLGSAVEWVEEESYFFRLSEFGDRLLAHIEANPDFIAPPERKNEVVSFIKSGLRDISVSRTNFDWGVKVPGDEKHVMYVWVDALTNYITAAGFPDETSERWRFWPADLHMIGKDIVRFHAVYWPAFLMSADLPLPKRVYAHGFLTNKGEKMSKSVGNVVDPFEMIEKYGLDQVRYFFMREVPFGKDGSYSHEAIVNRINADLANDLGNLAQRSLAMIAKNCAGKIPAPTAFSDEDKDILGQAEAVLPKARTAMDEQAIHKALEAIFNVVANANKYFAAQEPWARKKDDPERMGTILYVTAEVIRQVSILCQMIMPQSAEKLLDLLAVAPDQRGFANLGEAHRLIADTSLPTPTGVFPRFIEEKKEQA
ncbi:MAG: methionine--tRNA ligase [Hyphomicrobiaceae bacterium]|nr:methionine--tRNA ligase [Hyphomicrobiaceae bacterium]